MHVQKPVAVLMRATLAALVCEISVTPHLSWYQAKGAFFARWNFFFFFKLMSFYKSVQLKQAPFIAMCDIMVVIWI